MRGEKNIYTLQGGGRPVPGDPVFNSSSVAELEYSKTNDY